MLGILWFLFWQALGVLLAYKYFAEKRLAVRLWLGSAAGTVLSMWAPIPFAFLMGFTRGAHLAGLGCGFIIAALSLRLHRKTPFSPDADEPRGDHDSDWRKADEGLGCGRYAGNRQKSC